MKLNADVGIREDLCSVCEHQFREDCKVVVSVGHSEKVLIRDCWKAQGVEAEIIITKCCSFLRHEFVEV